MQTIKFLLSVLLIWISGCKMLHKKSAESYRTGYISMEEVKHYKWFKKEYKTFQFSKSKMDSLAGLKNFKITIIGGEWCSDTKKHLTGFIKILETVGFKEENLKIIFVNRSKQKPPGFDDSFEKLDVKFIPTFIIFNQSGKEVGRIVEAPTKSLEEDLLKIINQR